MFKKKLNQRGQGMTEYIILIAFIAIVCIAAVKYFGGKTKEGFTEAGNAVGGATETMKSAGSSGSGSATDSVVGAAKDAALGAAGNALKDLTGSK